MNHQGWLLVVICSMWLHKVQLYSLQLLMSNFHQTNKVLLFFHLMVLRLKMLRVYLVYTVQVWINYWYLKLFPSIMLLYLVLLLSILVLRHWPIIPISAFNKISFCCNWIILLFIIHLLFWKLVFVMYCSNKC